ncbi:MAG: hypothetical protein R2712_19385 [Vicinamibacterales bacterium]
MRRRTLLQTIVSTLPLLPMARVRLSAQVRRLTPESVAMLHEVGGTVLPASIGTDRVSLIVDRFVAWAHEYEEGVALAHGYGHPRLAKAAASPVPDYIAQLSALGAAASARGGAFSSLSLDVRRTLLTEALASAKVTDLPSRPAGRHVVADLMAYYFRSSEANDQAYRARIGRQVCRPLALTTRRPAPLA